MGNESQKQGPAASAIAKRAAEMALKWTEQAEEAMKVTDIAALRALLQDAVKHNLQLAAGFDSIISLYVSKDGKPLERPAESESAIGAMREVALAAIELAKTVNQSR
jgi:hypothetical protein